MTEQEKATLEKLVGVISEQKKEEKAYTLGVVEGMAIMGAVYKQRIEAQVTT